MPQRIEVAEDTRISYHRAQQKIGSCAFFRYDALPVLYHNSACHDKRKEVTEKRFLHRRDVARKVYEHIHECKEQRRGDKQ